MATLDANNRALTAAQYMRDFLPPTGLVKQDLKDAIAAVDDWFEQATIQTSLNSYVQTAFRSKAGVYQKIAPQILVFMAVVLMRKIGKFPAQEDVEGTPP